MGGLRRTCILALAEDAGAGEKADAFRAFERKHAAAPGNDVNDELCMLPIFVLRLGDVKRAAADFAKQHVGIADDQLTERVAHRRAAVAAAAGLMEHKWAVFRL